MAAKTRLTPDGYGGRRNGSFAGRASLVVAPARIVAADGLVNTIALADARRNTFTLADARANTITITESIVG